MNRFATMFGSGERFDKVEAFLECGGKRQRDTAFDDTLREGQIGQFASEVFVKTGGLRRSRVQRQSGVALSLPAAVQKLRFGALFLDFGSGVVGLGV
jgi:hypothetical protein